MKLLVLLFGLLLMTACGTPPAAIIESVSVTASSQNAFGGSSQVLFADVSGSGEFNKNVTWSTTAGELSKNTGSVVTFKAPSVTSSTDVSVTATSKADSSKKDTVVVKVNPVPVTSSITAVALTADVSSLNAASPAVLSANVSGTNGFAPDVNWSIISGTGTISAPSGASITFTAPSLASSSVTIVRATSVQDPSKSNTIGLNVNALPAGSSITGVAVSALATTLEAATTTTVNAVVTGTNGFGTGVLWNVVSGAGTISASTGSSITFTAPSLASSSATIFRATSVQDPSKSGVITINTNALPAGSSIDSVSVSSSATTLNAAGTANLSAQVFGANGFSNEVTWSIASGGGSLSAVTGSSVIFTAPNLANASTAIVRATSVQDPSKSEVVSIFINSGSSISFVSVTTSLTNLNAFDSAILTANVTGTNGFDDRVIWSIVSGASGTLSTTTGSSIFFTASNIPGAVIVRATSVQDPSKSNQVRLYVARDFSVTGVAVSANANPVNAGGIADLTATVSGSGNFSPAVIWSIVSGTGTLTNLATTVTAIRFTAPSLVNASSTIVRATSVQDPSKSGTVTLNINSNTLGSSITGINIAASQVALHEGNSSVLQGVVSGTGAFNNAVTWNIETGGVGILSSNVGSTVSYTAPATSFGRIVRITATSLQDPTQKKTLFVSVNPNKASISGGGQTSLALKPDGTLLSWGYDGFGQLGDGGTNTDQPTPVVVFGANNIVAIASGALHSLALKSDGTLLSWGYDLDGELGDGGTNTDKSTPVVVSGANNIVAIAAGEYHSLALKSNGTLLSWGKDNNGQLGDGGTDTNQPTPVAVPNASDIVAIAAGQYHSIALKSDGTLLSWGFDGFGQLGNGGTNTSQATPVAVVAASNIVAIAAGQFHSLALKSNGTLLSWGYDGFGQLGDGGTNTDQPTPVVVFGANNIVAIASGALHSLALKSDGTLLSWGYDAFGELGDGGTNTNQAIPVAVSGASNIVAIAAGEIHSLALKSDGTLLSWGGDANGQLGDNITNNEQHTPIAVLLGINLIRLP